VASGQLRAQCLQRSPEEVRGCSRKLVHTRIAIAWRDWIPM
jgi:hypothetical protein